MGPKTLGFSSSLFYLEATAKIKLEGKS